MSRPIIPFALLLVLWFPDLGNAIGQTPSPKEFFELATQVEENAVAVSETAFRLDRIVRETKENRERAFLFMALNALGNVTLSLIYCGHLIGVSQFVKSGERLSYHAHVVEILREGKRLVSEKLSVLAEIEDATTNEPPL